MYLKMQLKNKQKNYLYTNQSGKEITLSPPYKLLPDYPLWQQGNTVLNFNHLFWGSFICQICTSLNITSLLFVFGLSLFLLFYDFLFMCTNLKISYYENALFYKNINHIDLASMAFKHKLEKNICFIYGMKYYKMKIA